MKPVAMSARHIESLGLASRAAHSFASAAGTSFDYKTCESALCVDLREILELVRSLESGEAVNVPRAEIEELADDLESDFHRVYAGRMRDWLTSDSKGESEMSEATTPKIELVQGEIASLSLRPGDRLVILYDITLSREASEGLRRQMEQWASVPCAVLDSGARLAVIRATDAEVLPEKPAFVELDARSDRK